MSETLSLDIDGVTYILIGIERRSKSLVLQTLKNAYPQIDIKLIKIDGQNTSRSKDEQKLISKLIATGNKILYRTRFFL